MRISRQSRKFHDPWGNKNGNLYGSPCRFQYMVARSELQDFEPRMQMVSGYVWYWDKPGHHLESNKNRYVRCGKRGVEKIRR